MPEVLFLQGRNWESLLSCCVYQGQKEMKPFNFLGYQFPNVFLERLIKGGGDGALAICGLSCVWSKWEICPAVHLNYSHSGPTHTQRDLGLFTPHVSSSSASSADTFVSSTWVMFCDKKKYTGTQNDVSKCWETEMSPFIAWAKVVYCRCSASVNSIG